MPIVIQMHMRSDFYEYDLKESRMNLIKMICLIVLATHINEFTLVIIFYSASVS